MTTYLADYQELRRIVNSKILSLETLSDGEIKKTAAKYRQIFENLTDEDVDKIVAELEMQHNVFMDIGATIQDSSDFKPWLLDRKAHEGYDEYYWERYKTFLLEHKGFSRDVVASLGQVTDNILGLTENPLKDGPWARKGMVVGHVQSGKTANYTGLICKAADAGYKVIIVIAGIHNKLRSQTQSRIDEGFIGKDTSNIMSNTRTNVDRFGVGAIDPSRFPTWFTTSKNDFKKGTAMSVGMQLQSSPEPAVFVIKKNVSSLKALVEWLKAFNAHQFTKTSKLPLLLIDDEADNASINIKKSKDDISRINGQIRELLRVFERSSYVSYTATPFANIFIDPDDDDEHVGEDLFPRNFIVSLDPPDNYVGAEKVFELDDEGNFKSRNLVLIEDFEPDLPLKHKIDHNLDSLPESLFEAVQSFIIARAIRILRGQTNKHNSMMINASRFIAVQDKIRYRVYDYLEELRKAIKINGGKPVDLALKDDSIRGIKLIFERQYSTQIEPDITWQKIQTTLLEAIGPIRVESVNSKGGALNYEDYHDTGLNVIAIGGFTLSRGLTLEGLTISYFLRNSMMYDTLLQMGRWFGYRPGYEDLCRIFMPREAAGWYAHIASAAEELRDDIKEMESVGGTPEDFGLKVRTHPANLIVTAKNKIGRSNHQIVSISLAGHLTETSTILKNPADIQNNINAASLLLSEIRDSNIEQCEIGAGKGGYLYKGVPCQFVLDFLARYRNDQKSLQSDPIKVSEYINKRFPTELSEWDVYFAAVSDKRVDKERTLVSNVLGLPINCQRRREGKTTRTDSNSLQINENRRVSASLVTSVGFDEELEIQSDDANKKRSDRQILLKRTTPILVIHLLAIGEEGDDLRETEPKLAWSIGFPGKTNFEDTSVEYLVNTTWMQEDYELSAVDEEEDGYDS